MDIKNLYSIFNRYQYNILISPDRGQVSGLAQGRRGIPASCLKSIKGGNFTYLSSCH